ncbi:MAG: putative motility protein [Clostridiales bacterium]|nr:putative motility protein [Clostridiales bacterium]
MDIPALSMVMAQSNLQTDIGIAMLDKAIDLGDSLGEGMVAMIDSAAMERSVTPYLGANIDISV